ncbi:hypothetical protein Tco_1499425 [Tanacetum coccineum]
MSSLGAPSAGPSTPPIYSSGPSTPPSYSSGPSTTPNYSPEKEEFGLIDPPKRMCDIWRDHYSCINDHLVDLNGEVGFVCVRTMVNLGIEADKNGYLTVGLKLQNCPGGCMDVLGLLE